MTPEGKVKAAVKKFLKQWDVWTDWPVPSGYGKSTLDCMVICNGQVMWIETKAPGEELTPRQERLWNELVRHGCMMVKVDTIDTSHWIYLDSITGWMNRVGARRVNTR
jgi:hypothetical protein